MLYILCEGIQKLVVYLQDSSMKVQTPQLLIEESSDSLKLKHVNLYSTSRKVRIRRLSPA